MAGALACMVLGQPAQQTAAQDVAQQSIPDAPRPQGLPVTGTRPGMGTTATSNGDEAPDPQQPTAPTTSLPQTKPTASNPDEGAAPEVPAAGQGAKAFTLPSIQVNLVEVPFTVKDKSGKLVPGLTWRDVRVYENGLRQQMRLFTVDPWPLSVAVVIDQSLTVDNMAKVNAAMTALSDAFSPYDEVAVFTYNNGPQMRTPFTAGQSDRLKFVLDSSRTTGREPLQPLGGPLAQTIVRNDQQFDPNTSANRNRASMQINPPREVHTLNDAILAAAIATSKAGKGRRRVVYVISDGKEYGSQAKYKDVVKYLQTNKVAVYGTLVGDSSLPVVGYLDKIHLPLMMKDNLLPAYASETGGYFDAEFRQKGIEQSFARITEEARNQYTIGYYTHEPFIDGKYRPIEVKVLKPGLNVIAKKGYFPSATDIKPANPVTPQ
ncbi:VWA domain-containing protein [Edaphobacter aggregans]|nr:VWA domain-containing protein [Edaphobacter aggregans]